MLQPPAHLLSARALPRAQGQMRLAHKVCLCLWLASDGLKACPHVPPFTGSVCCMYLPEPCHGPGGQCVRKVGDKKQSQCCRISVTSCKRCYVVRRDVVPEQQDLMYCLQSQSMYFLMR